MSALQVGALDWNLLSNPETLKDGLAPREGLRLREARCCDCPDLAVLALKLVETPLMQRDNAPCSQDPALLITGAQSVVC